MVDLGPDLQATYQDGKLMILRRGVIREFQSVSHYLDTVSSVGGRVPTGITKALREFERLNRIGDDPENIEHASANEAGRKGTPHWLI